MKRTVIVIGAGASADFGITVAGQKVERMPTGEELVEQIADQNEIKKFFHYEMKGYLTIRGKELDKNSCEELFKDKKYKPYLDISKIVSYYQPFSIDELLDSIRQDKISIEIKDVKTKKEDLIEAGKTLIAMFLLRAEDVRIFNDSGTTCWYRHLRSAIITSGKNDDEIAEKLKNLTIISFNYDRSLDYFLRTRLGKFYGKIKVIYPYGKLAGDWDEGGKDYSYIPYGSFKKSGEADDKKRNEIFQAAKIIRKERGEKGLKIIGESKIKREEENYETYRENLLKIIKSESEIIEERVAAKTLWDISNAMMNAEKFYFLGFGFHEENCRIILLRELRRDNQLFYYTNLDGSKKIDASIANFLRGFSILEGKTKLTSDRGVHEALRQDFNLEL